MLPLRLFSGLLFLPAVLADGAAIVAAMGPIATYTAALNDTILAWDGGLLGVLPITVTSTKLLKSIHSATHVAEASAKLEVLEAISVALTTQSLITDVNTTLTSLIAAEPKFADLHLQPVILLNLRLQKHATEEFSAAVADKVPTDLVPAAQSLGDQIDASFQTAIDAFESWWDK